MWWLFISRHRLCSSAKHWWSRFLWWWVQKPFQLNEQVYRSNVVSFTMFNLSSTGQKDGSKLSGVYGNGYKGRWYIRRSVFFTQYIVSSILFLILTSHPLCLFRLICHAVNLVSVFWPPFPYCSSPLCSFVMCFCLAYCFSFTFVPICVGMCVLCVCVVLMSIVMCFDVCGCSPPVCLFVLSSGVFHVLLCLCI